MSTPELPNDIQELMVDVRPPHLEVTRICLCSKQPLILENELSATLVHRKTVSVSGTEEFSSEIHWTLSQAERPEQQLIQAVGSKQDEVYRSLGNYRWRVARSEGVGEQMVVELAMIRCGFSLETLRFPAIEEGGARTFWLSTHGMLRIFFGTGIEEDLLAGEPGDRFLLTLELSPRVKQYAGAVVAKLWAARFYDRYVRRLALWLPDGTPINVGDHNIEVLDVQLGEGTTPEGDGGLQSDLFVSLHVQVRVTRLSMVKNDAATAPEFAPVELGRPFKVSGQRRISAIRNSEWATLPGRGEPR